MTTFCCVLLYAILFIFFLSFRSAAAEPEEETDMTSYIVSASYEDWYDEWYSETEFFSFDDAREEEARLYEQYAAGAIHVVILGNKDGKRCELDYLGNIIQS